MSFSLSELETYVPTSGKNYYTGPTTFEGEKIAQEHSPRKFIRSVHSYLEATQFVAINLIGNMGTGKTTCATMLAHIWHELKPETTVIWAGSEELKRLSDFLGSLEFGKDYLLIFDDSSNILDTLSGDEVSEAFNSYTKSRHTTGSRLGIVLIYHYTYSMRKNFRSSSTFTIYTSCGLTEYGNILHMLGKNRKSVKTLNNFVKVYHRAYSTEEKSFELDIGGTKAWFVRDKPFRFNLVITDFGSHLMAVKEMSCNLCAVTQNDKKIPPELVFDRLKKRHPKYASLALGIICYNKGIRTALPKELRRVLSFAGDFLKDYSTNYEKLGQLVRESRKLPDTRDYRNRKDEDSLRKEIINAANPFKQVNQDNKEINYNDIFAEKDNDLDKYSKEEEVESLPNFALNLEEVNNNEA